MQYDEQITDIRVMATHLDNELLIQIMLINQVRTNLIMQC